MKILFFACFLYFFHVIKSTKECWYGENFEAKVDPKEFIVEAKNGSFINSISFSESMQQEFRYETQIIYTGGNVQEVEMDKDYLYIANFADGLEIRNKKNVSDVLVKDFGNFYNGQQSISLTRIAKPNCKFHKDILFVIDFVHLAILNTSDITKPTLIDSFEIRQSYIEIIDLATICNNVGIVSEEGFDSIAIFDFKNMHIAGSFAKTGFVSLGGVYDYYYVVGDTTTYQNKVQMVNNEETGDPYIEAYMSSDFRPVSIDVSGHFVFIADKKYGLRIADISNPLYPNFISSLEIESSKTIPLAFIKAQREFVFLLSENDAIHIIDVIDPYSPKLVKKFYLKGTTYRINGFENTVAFIQSSSGFTLLEYSIYVTGTCGLGDNTIFFSVCNEDEVCENKNITILGKCKDLICGVNGTANSDCTKCNCDVGFINTIENQECRLPPSVLTCASGTIQIGENCISLNLLIFPTIGAISLISIVCILFLFVVLIVCCILTKRANRFNHIKGIEMLAKEAELEQNSTSRSSTVNIQIKKSNYFVDYKDIKLKKMIGSGGSNSQVYLADWNGEEIAYKGFNVSTAFESDNPTEEFEKEVRVWIGLSHPSILQFYGACVQFPKVGLLLEFCVHGDLPSFMSKRSSQNKKIPMNQKLRILKEIASGMSYLHSKMIIHRDLKPENVLIDENEHSKIMDFGISKLLKEENVDKTKTKMVGTSFYMAPEVIKGGKYSNKCDVYSFAILIYVLITENCLPYGKKGVNLHRISKDPNYRPTINEDNFEESKFLVSIMKKNWDFDPQKRDSFSEIKEILSSEKNEVTKTPKKKRSPPVPKSRKTPLKN